MSFSKKTRDIEDGLVIPKGAGGVGEGTDWEFAPAWRMDTQGPTAERRELC